MGQLVSTPTARKRTANLHAHTTDSTLRETKVNNQGDPCPHIFESFTATKINAASFLLSPERDTVTIAMAGARKGSTSSGPGRNLRTTRKRSHDQVEAETAPATIAQESSRSPRASKRQKITALPLAPRADSPIETVERIPQPDISTKAAVSPITQTTSKYAQGESPLTSSALSAPGCFPTPASVSPIQNEELVAKISSEHSYSPPRIITSVLNPPEQLRTPISSTSSTSTLATEVPAANNIEHGSTESHSTISTSTHIYPNNNPPTSEPIPPKSHPKVIPPRPLCLPTTAAINSDPQFFSWSNPVPCHLSSPNGTEHASSDSHSSREPARSNTSYQRPSQVRVPRQQPTFKRASDPQRPMIHKIQLEMRAFMNADHEITEAQRLDAGDIFLEGMSRLHQGFYNPEAVYEEVHTKIRVIVGIIKAEKTHPVFGYGTLFYKNQQALAPLNFHKYGVKDEFYVPPSATAKPAGAQVRGRRQRSNEQAEEAEQQCALSEVMESRATRASARRSAQCSVSSSPILAAENRQQMPNFLVKLKVRVPEQLLNCRKRKRVGEQQTVDARTVANPYKKVYGSKRVKTAL